MSLFTATLLSLISLSTSLSLPHNESRVPGIVQLPVRKVQNATTLGSSTKRQIVNNLANIEAGTLYLITLTIGTPPQSVDVQIDTGSSDLWVDPECSTAGSAGETARCNSYPVYNPYTSSTAEDTGNAMDLSYGKGSCEGEYLLDTVNLGGVNLFQQEFGWAQSSTSLSQGILGISFGIDLGTTYYNVIDQLYIQGYTASRAFSLVLGSVDTAEGSIIFGGVDTKKYIGALEKRPIIPFYDAPDDFPRYWIHMTSVGITVPGATTSKIYTVPQYNQAVFLDSGGTLSRLPTNLVDAIVADFPGAVFQGNGLYTVPCNTTSQTGSMDFGFGNTVIKVPYNQFIWVVGPDVCVLGVVATTGVDWVLGDTFLRSAYVIYDQDNRNLFLANTANCGENLVPIGSGANAVPSITGACQPSSTSPSSSSSKKTSSASSTKAASTTSKKVSTTLSSKSSTKSSSPVKTTTSSSSSKRSTSSGKSTTSSKHSTTTSTTPKPTSTSKPTSASKPTSTSKKLTSTSKPTSTSKSSLVTSKVSNTTSKPSRTTSLTSSTKKV